MGIPIRILVVEDSEDDAELLLRELYRAGYDPFVERVETRQQMLSAIELNAWDLIISDYSLPHFSGKAALDLYKDKELDIPFIVVSGAIGELTAVEMMKLGVHDYLLKGNLTRLGAAIERELREAEVRYVHKQAEIALRESETRYRTLIETMQDGVSMIDMEGKTMFCNKRKAEMLGFGDGKDLLGMLEQEFFPTEEQERFAQELRRLFTSGSISNLEFMIRRRDKEVFPVEISASLLMDEKRQAVAAMEVMRDITERKRAEMQIRQANQDLSDAYDATLEGWSRALELREQETAGHSQRTVSWTLRLGEAMGIKQEELVHVRRGALLHDIGIMGIPDSILLKPGPLTEDEWVVMRQHPVYAYHLLANIAYLSPALEIPYCHHEKWDGTGYPQGLRGKEIPLAARIFSVVDVWDALTSSRPYRPAWPEEAVRAHLLREAGKSFDPAVVDTFFKVLV